MNYTKSNYRTVPNMFTGIFEDLFQNNFHRIVRDDYGNPNPAPINIKETETNYEMAVSVPGIKKEQLKLAVEDNKLKISFEAVNTKEESDTEKWLRKEFQARSFSRSFTLNEHVNAQAIQANHVDGVLYISLPKKEQNAPEKQEITIG